MRTLVWRELIRPFSPFLLFLFFFPPSLLLPATRTPTTVFGDECGGDEDSDFSSDERGEVRGSEEGERRKKSCCEAVVLFSP